MNRQSMRRLIACSSLVALGLVCNASAAETAGAPPGATEQAAQPAAEGDTGKASAPAQSEAQPAAEAPTPAADQPAQEASGEQGVAPSSAPEGAAPDSETAAGEEGGEEAEKTETPEKEGEPITGAFGLQLGDRFDPCMVDKLISQEDKGYSGGNHEELMGTRYTVEPKVPNPHFQTYLVDTTADGIIYAIRADYDAPERTSVCDVVKKLASFLADKYGVPRGKGAFGEWYAFRDMSKDGYRGVRLYAQRCRRGHYTILYSDDEVRESPPPPAEEITERSGL